jgi:hypothetical protein
VTDDDRVPATAPTASSRPRDGRPRPDPDLPPPTEAATPVPVVHPDDESGRQAAATARSVSRLEEAN